MTNTPIAILLIVSIVALGALTAINIQTITGNFQLQQRAPIEGLAAYFTYQQPCDERVIGYTVQGLPIKDDPDWCLKVLP